MNQQQKKSFHDYTVTSTTTDGEIDQLFSRVTSMLTTGFTTKLAIVLMVRKLTRSWSKMNLMKYLFKESRPTNLVFKMSCIAVIWVKPLMESVSTRLVLWKLFMWEMI